MKIGPQSARAIGGFNLTAQPMGFLQPLFAGNHGDNQTYIQRLDGLARIAGFDPVAWPERDTVTFSEPRAATINGESLWSFTFPNEKPLILPWEQFRQTLAARIENDAFANHPLLQFDVVQTLSLEDKKYSTFTLAYNAYLRAGTEVAERWRDRSILEPELLEAIDSTRMGTRLLRARIIDGVARIELDRIDRPLGELFENRCREIAAKYETIFPKVRHVEAFSRLNHKLPPFRESSKITIILVGKLNRHKVAAPPDGESEFEIVAADHLSSYLRRHPPSRPLLLLSRQSDWRQIIQAADSIKHLPSLAVIFSSSIEPMASDSDIQKDLQIPSVLMFALTNRFFETTIRPLIDILSFDLRPHQTSFDFAKMPARHCLLVREEIELMGDASELGSKIGARAIRAGVHPGARIEIFVDGISAGKGNEWGKIFEPLFATPYPSETILQTPSKRRYLSLLAERTLFEERHLFASMENGITRLLRMRGWRVEFDERARRKFIISDNERQFNALFVFRKSDIPAEDRFFERPSFGRSHLLIIHASPNRETLLIGNRGQYSHVTLEDIPIMQPGKQWIWPVLRRQLNARSTKGSLAALRLSASLAAEALLIGRIGSSVGQQENSERLISLLQSNDCERFLDFIPEKSEHSKTFGIRVRSQDLPEFGSTEIELRLVIEDEGPVVYLL